jgi:hypothetical protein
MDIFGPLDSIYADVAAEHPTKLTEAHLGVMAKCTTPVPMLPNFMRSSSANGDKQNRPRPGGLVCYAPDASQPWRASM